MKKFLLKYIKNKFVIVTLVFIVWVGIIDDRYSIFRQYRLKSKINELNDNKRLLIKEIEENKPFADKLESDMEFIEKYGREVYFLKKEDETIFYLVPPSNE